jgi:hypothetical protein
MVGLGHEDVQYLRVRAGEARNLHRFGDESADTEALGSPVRR